MTGLLILAGAWAACTVTVVGVILYADREPLADLGPEERAEHEPETCPACVAADDAVMERFDLTPWSIECEGAL